MGVVGRGQHACTCQAAATHATNGRNTHRRHTRQTGLKRRRRHARRSRPRFWARCERLARNDVRWRTGSQPPSLTDVCMAAVVAALHRAARSSASALADADG